MESARASLDAQLARRAAAASQIAGEVGADLPWAVDLHDAAVAVLATPVEQEALESALTRAIRAALGAAPEQAGALLDPSTRVRFARQFHNDAVHASLALRRRRVIRWLRLWGRPGPRRTSKSTTRWGERGHLLGFTAYGDRMSRRQRMTLVAAALGFSGVLTACSGGTHVTKKLTVSAPVVSAIASASPSPKPALPPPIGPPGHYSGIATKPGSPVLAIKIENTVAGRPQAGVNSADLVYVEQVEGGLTRLLAIYNSRLPPMIGPVRSARSDNTQLLGQFGPVAFAYSGAQPAVLAVVAASNLVDVGYNDESQLYTLLPGRYAPENLFVDPAKLLAVKHGIGAKDIGLRFSQTPPPGPAATSAAVGYPAAKFVFGYDAASRGYTITQDGTLLRGLDNKLESAKNIVVQNIQQVVSGEVDVLGNATPANVTTGSGSATLYRNGRAIPLHWSRGSDTSSTYYSYEGTGKRMVLNPGTTWIMLLPPDGTSSSS